MRIAAAQVRCPWLDPAAGTAKVLDHLELAAAEDVGLIAFPEAFLSGYPFWIKHTGGAGPNDVEQKRAHAAYLKAAVELDGPQVRSITEAARDLGIFTYVGITERVRTTVYCTLPAISPEHGLVGAHRKLVPTHEERLVWGAGDGQGLRVHQVRDLRVGGLDCWENRMPLARHAMYAQGEHVHVSVWPGSPRSTTDITRFIVLQGRVHSLAAGALFSYADVPADFPFYEQLAGRTSYCDGGSVIAGPDGQWIVAPVSDEERLLIADAEPSAVLRERRDFDPTGHCMVVALGIGADGTKTPLGLWEGATEDKAVVTALLTDLVERGLDAAGGLLADAISMAAVTKVREARTLSPWNWKSARNPAPPPARLRAPTDDLARR